MLLKTSVTDTTENEPAETERQDVVQDIGILYKLFGKAKEHDRLRFKFGELVKQIGTDMVLFSFLFAALNS